MIIDQIFSRTGEKKSMTIDRERPIRSFVKALSWRAFGTIDTIMISWIIAGDVAIAFSIGLFELITKTLLYYFHERMWNNIKWGK